MVGSRAVQRHYPPCKEGIRATIARTLRLSSASVDASLACRGTLLADTSWMNTKKTSPGATSPKQQPDEPLGDRGDEKTWEPPRGEQGISNRPDDEEMNRPEDRPSTRE